MLDPVVQRYMSHFYDIHGTLHITIRPDLTDALGWAKSKREVDKDPELLESTPVGIELEYDSKGNIDGAKLTIRPKFSGEEKDS